MTRHSSSVSVSTPNSAAFFGFDAGMTNQYRILEVAGVRIGVTAVLGTKWQAEIDNAAINVVKTHERKEILSQSVAAARRSLEIAQTRYQEGYADFQRVLDAQRTLFSQADRELSNRASHIAAIVALYQALGGGWMAATVNELVPETVQEEMKSRTDWGDLLERPLPAGMEGPMEKPTDE